VDPWEVMVELRRLAAGGGADRDEVVGMMARIRIQPCHVQAMFGAMIANVKTVTAAPPLL